MPTENKAKPDKVPLAEYRDSEPEPKIEKSNAALEVLAKSGDVAAQKALDKLRGPKVTEIDGFEVGKPAPKTLYLDRLTGQINDRGVSDGIILVVKDDNVTQAIFNALVNNG